MKRLIVILEEVGLVKKVFQEQRKCTVYQVNFESEFFKNLDRTKSESTEDLNLGSQRTTYNNNNNIINNSTEVDEYDVFFKEREKWNYSNLAN